MHELRAETPPKTSQRQQNKQSSKKTHVIESVMLPNVENQQNHNRMSNKSIEMVKLGSLWVKSYGTKFSALKSNTQYFQSHV